MNFNLANEPQLCPARFQIIFIYDFSCHKSIRSDELSDIAVGESSATKKSMFDVNLLSLKTRKTDNIFNNIVIVFVNTVASRCIMT